MMSPSMLFLMVLLYGFVLFGVASYAVSGARTGRSRISHPAIYVLSLGIWHTSWTFYGNVGRMSTVGMDFMAIYLGVTLVVGSWWFVLRKMIRICRKQQIVSIADLISSRYGHSLPLGMLVAVFSLVVTLPYIALQLKAISDTFALLSTPLAPGADFSFAGFSDMALPAALILGGFAVLFGARHLDPLSRHEGLVAAVALGSLVKLIAMVAVGLFFVFGMFDGPADLFGRFLTELPRHRHLLLLGTEQIPFSSWFSMGLVSMLAFMCLPHMFHLQVVENTDPRHVTDAMWMFPLYMFAIQLFIVPIALGGLVLAGGQTPMAEYFALFIPLAAGKDFLALLVFIGGISGAAAMVMVSAVALANLMANHLAVPVLLKYGLEQEGFSRKLLVLKQMLILAVVLMGYAYYRLMGDKGSLVDTGLIAFVGAAQLAPALFGGLFWRRANRNGALTGLCLGVLVWFVTLMLPALVRAGWLEPGILEQGLFGCSMLKPAALLGLDNLQVLPHALFWSLGLNLCGYVVLSLFTQQQARELEQSEKFVDAADGVVTTGAQRRLTKAPTVVEFVELMAKFVGETKAYAAIADYLGDKEIDTRGSLGEREIADLKRFSELTLAGSVGAVPARIIIENYLSSRGSEMEDVFDIFGSVTISRKAGREQLGVLHEAARLVSGGLELNTILDNLLDLLQEQFRLDLCVVRVLDESSGLLQVISRRGVVLEHFGEAERTVDQETYVGEVFLNNSAMAVNDTDFLEKPLPAILIRREKILSFAHAPIDIEGQAVGVLSAFSRSAKGIFTNEFMELFENLAGQMGVALRNARQTAQLISAREREMELQLARSVQQSLLPEKTPDVSGISLAGACIPAREVGGDYFDYFPSGEAGMDLLIADVSGHDFGAALLMAEVRTFIRAKAEEDLPPARMLEVLNAFFYEDLSRSELFITLMYLRYAPEDRRLTFSGAGHNPPLLRRAADATCVPLASEGLILGVLEQVSFTEKHLQLEPGDLLLLYTDGIIEGQSPDGELFGEERLAALLHDLHDLEPEEIIQRILEQLRLFIGEASFKDDVSMVAMKLARS